MSFSSPSPGPLSGAWLCVNGHGRVLHASSAAHQLLAVNAGVLTVAGQYLLAPREPDRIEQMLQQWRDRGLGAAALARDDRLPLTLLCERAGSTAKPGEDRAVAGEDGPGQAWLTLRDPEAEQPDLARVRALFALTPSEASVAVGLALGRSSSDIAASMGVQPNTVLTHVKRVLAKTGTRRQAQLVSLLLRSVAVVPLTVPPQDGLVERRRHAPGLMPFEVGSRSPEPPWSYPFR